MKKYFYAISPYIAVLVGLYLFKNAFLTLVLYHLGILVAILIFGKDFRPSTLFQIRNLKLFVTLSAVYAFSGIVIFYIWPYIKIPNIDIVSTLSSYGLDGTNKIIFLIYYSTINPVLEELYWRFVLDSRNKYLSLSDVLFAAYHILILALFFKAAYLILFFLGLLLVARFWRYLRQNLSENLLVFTTHIIADFSIMYFIFLLK